MLFELFAGITNWTSPLISIAAVTVFFGIWRVDGVCYSNPPAGHANRTAPREGGHVNIDGASRIGARAPLIGTQLSGGINSPLGAAGWLFRSAFAGLVKLETHRLRWLSPSLLDGLRHAGSEPIIPVALIAFLMSGRGSAAAAQIHEALAVVGKPSRRFDLKPGAGGTGDVAAGAHADNALEALLFGGCQECHAVIKA